jgi:FKBP-type peptidyl-prolyl cis-trans isomerase
MRLVLTLPLLTLAAVACSKLTSPPGPEPIASDTPVTMASQTAPTPALSARVIPTATQQPQQPTGPQGELKIDDLIVGKGPEVKNGDTVVVHYTGTLVDGTKFDSSHDHPGNQPFVTSIPGRVIQGWNKGIPGMRVGGKRKLTVPPNLGYGAMPQAKIPANSTLLFEVELVEIKSNPHAPPLPKGP